MIPMLVTSQLVIYAGQDVRMAYGGDIENIVGASFIPNYHVGIENRINFKEFDLILKPEFEYNSFYEGDYKRYSMSVGLNFRNVIKRFEFSTLFGYGLADFDRDGQGNNEFLYGMNLTNQLTYKITDNFGIYTDVSLIQEGWEDNSTDIFLQTFRITPKIGIKLYINTKKREDE